MTGGVQPTRLSCCWRAFVFPRRARFFACKEPYCIVSELEDLEADHDARCLVVPRANSSGWDCKGPTLTINLDVSNYI